MKGNIKKSIILPSAIMLAKAIGKMHVLPGKNIKAISFMANLLSKNYEEAEKSLKDTYKWKQSFKDKAIDALGILSENISENNLIEGNKNHEKIINIWIRGIEKGLVNDESDREKIMLSLGAVKMNDNDELLEKWLMHQPLNKNIIHEVGASILKSKTSHQDGMWHEFQEKYIDKMNPNYILDNPKKKIPAIGRKKHLKTKFISIAFAYGPQSLCFDMVDKTSYIDKNELASFLLRREATSMVLIEKMSGKCGGMENMIREMLKKYNINIFQVKKENLKDTNDDIWDKLSYLEEDNKIIGSLLKQQWISVMTDKQKNEIRANIKEKTKRSKKKKI